MRWLLHFFLNESSTLHVNTASETSRFDELHDDDMSRSSPSVSSLWAANQEDLFLKQGNVTADTYDNRASLSQVIDKVDESESMEQDEQEDLKLPAVALETGCDKNRMALAFYDSDPHMMDHDAERAPETLVLDTIIFNGSFQDVVTMMNTKSVFFNWTTHPWYKAYRETIRFFSANQVDYPTCPANLVMQALDAVGFHDFYVHVDEHGAPLKTIFGEGRCSFLGRWVRCSEGQALAKVRDRFREDRKDRAKPMAVLTANMAQRQPWFPNPITDACVCFDWDNHLGTIRFKQVVRTVSNDRTSYPRWNNDVANLIRNALHQQGLTVFLVHLNRDGRSCRSIHHGQWFLALDDECERMTKKEFQQGRRRRMK
jgi:hypothetical protein